MTTSAAGPPPPTPANSLRSDSAGGRRRRLGALDLFRAGVGGTPAALLIAAGAGIVFFFDPATAGFYPPCLFKTIFGAPCPGCGSLRALHQLLHLNVEAAWALNKPVVVGLPLAAAAALIGIASRRTKSSNG